MNLNSLDVLKLNNADHSYTFIQPDNQQFDKNVIVVYQDTFGQVQYWIHDQTQLKQYLNQDQITQVLNFLKN